MPRAPDAQFVFTRATGSCACESVPTSHVPLVVGRGVLLDDAMAALVDEIDDYADQWTVMLHSTPTHAGRRQFVEFVQTTRRDELVAWILDHMTY